MRGESVCWEGEEVQKTHDYVHVHQSPSSSCLTTTLPVYNVRCVCQCQPLDETVINPLSFKEVTKALA